MPHEPTFSQSAQPHRSHIRQTRIVVLILFVALLATACGRGRESAQAATVEDTPTAAEQQAEPDAPHPQASAPTAPSASSPPPPRPVTSPGSSPRRRRHRDHAADGRRRRPASLPAHRVDIRAMNEADMVIYSGLHLEGQFDAVFEALREQGTLIYSLSQPVKKGVLSSAALSPPSPNPAPMTPTSGSIPQLGAYHRRPGADSGRTRSGQRRYLHRPRRRLQRTAAPTLCLGRRGHALRARRSALPGYLTRRLPVFRCRLRLAHGRHPGDQHRGRDRCRRHPAHRPVRRRTGDPGPLRREQHLARHDRGGPGRIEAKGGTVRVGVRELYSDAMGMPAPMAAPTSA